MSLLCVIPAKSTSVRCANKNWRAFAGSTLTQIAVECAREAGLQPIVLADAGYPGGLDCEVRIRPDGSPDNTWQLLEQEFGKADVVLLQPTSPLRSAAFVRACVNAATAGGGRRNITSANHRRPSGSVYIRFGGSWPENGLLYHDSNPSDIDTEWDFSVAEHEYVERRALV